MELKDEMETNPFGEKGWMGRATWWLLNILRKASAEISMGAPSLPKLEIRLDLPSYFESLHSYICLFFHCPLTVNREGLCELP